MKYMTLLGQLKKHTGSENKMDGYVTHWELFWFALVYPPCFWLGCKAYDLFARAIERAHGIGE